MDNQPVSFPTWKESLTRVRLASAVESAFAREIITFLKYCKTNHVPATVRLAKHYIEQQERLRPGPLREALRWFFRSARQAGQPARTGDPGKLKTVAPLQRPVIPSSPQGLRPMQPKRARDDLGASGWELALIKTMRLRGLLWRTEYTYRSWARRFAHYLAPKTPYAAGGEEVQEFLTDLAVHGRASASGQRQALNALVFLMQEALGRDLGAMDFKRAVPRERVPVVLTRGGVIGSGFGAWGY